MRGLGGAFVVTALLVSACESTVDQVTISAEREGLDDDEPDPVLGTWTSRAPMGGVVVLSFGHACDVG